MFRLVAKANKLSHLCFLNAARDVVISIDSSVKHEGRHLLG